MLIHLADETMNEIALPVAHVYLFTTTWYNQIMAVVLLIDTVFSMSIDVCIA